MRALVLAAAASALAVPSSAQSWSAGAAWGVTENVSHRFSLDELKSRDLFGWVQYQAQPDVLLRATYGSLKTTAANSERTVSDGSSEVQAPRLTSHVDYLTLSASYELVTGDYTSGIFAGIGGYKLKPDAAPAGFEFARDPDRTVLGWHFGLDGSARIVSHLSAVGRFTLHGFEADQRHTILTAAAGLSWRF
jgi:hypothetical protein